MEYGMKFTAVLVTMILASVAFCQDQTIISYNQEAFDLTQKFTAFSQGIEEGDASGVTSMGAERKSPGKALMLSAIMPGAGELYAGSPLKAILFFGIEVGAWAGVAIYQADGKDKETQFEEYADTHWSKGDYWQWLESLDNWVEPLNTPRIPYPDLDEDYYPQSVYNDFEDDNAFTHNLPLTKTQQYYEMIGKYITQFGPGWNDADPTAISNGPEIFHFTGESQNSKDYMDMRYESNQALDKSAMFFQIVMLNHVASALDAGFTVRAMNKKLDTAFQFAPYQYYDEHIAMGQITVNW